MHWMLRKDSSLKISEGMAAETVSATTQVVLALTASKRAEIMGQYRVALMTVRWPLLDIGFAIRQRTRRPEEVADAQGVRS
jgi:hypothetical protein